MSGLRLIWRLLKLTAPFKWWIALAALLGFATIGSSIGLMATSAYIIAKAALHPSIADLQVAIVGVRFFGISRGVFRYLERYVSHKVTFNLLARLRVWFYRALEPLAPARLMQYKSGDLLSRIVADIETLENFYVRVLAPPLVALLIAALLWVILAGFDSWLAAATLFFLLLAGVGAPLLTRHLSRQPGRHLVDTRSALNAALVDGIQGVPDLLAFGQARRHLALVRQLDQTLAHLQNRMAQITGLGSALSGLLANLATLAVLLIAIPLVRVGQIDGVYLALLALAVIAAFEAVAPLPLAFQYLENSLAAARRLFEIVDSEPVVPPAVQSPLPPPQNYDIVVDRLKFSYDLADLPALNGLTFTLPQGGRLAIVGPSGAGKSTLVNLLLRFWDYQSGHIRLGGHELHRYRPADVRAVMSVVSQRTHLFNGTVRDNLLVAQPQAGPAEIIEAARQAQIHQFIQGLPQGYNTWVGEQGLRLSGGERQRLAIARAILKNAPILILDEATANLDPLTEREVMQALAQLMAGRTTLIITHRLVGLETVDKILVLQGGKIVAQGRHADLLAAGGLYRRMWELQTQTDLLEIFANAPALGVNMQAPVG